MPLVRPASDVDSILLRRVGAYLADIVVLFVVLAPLGFVVQRVIGAGPATANEVYVTLIFNFSVPAWAYFALADRSVLGATLGKRWFALRTEAVAGGRVRGSQAFLRTAVKMIPWELAHASAFLIAPSLGEFGAGSVSGMLASYALVLAYLVVAWRTGGRRSVHDLAAMTSVRRLHRD